MDIEIPQKEVKAPTLEKEIPQKEVKAPTVEKEKENENVDTWSVKQNWEQRCIHLIKSGEKDYMTIKLAAESYTNHFKLENDFTTESDRSYYLQPSVIFPNFKVLVA